MTDPDPYPNLIEFEVTGTAASQGSIAYHPVIGPDDKPLILNDRPVLRPHHDSKILKPWRRRVAANARIAMAGRPPLTGAIELSLTICRPRPKWNYNSRGCLKDSAPDHPITRPDTLKQVRAIEDALIGVVWNDDSQIVDHWLRKRYSLTPKVLISVRRKE
ncbi:MAG: RusA family crossover junction endodeoxyribonuclease [Acidimicrobiia bacterium]